MSENNLGRGAAYRQRRQERAAAEETFEVTLPSGAVFTLRKPNLEIYAVSGGLPLTLADKLGKLNAKNTTGKEVFKSLSVKEQTQSIEFMNKIVRAACVNPRIVDNPESEDEIAPEDLELGDYVFIGQWVQSNEVTEQLDSFRDERANGFDAELDLPELALPPVETAQDHKRGRGA